MIKSVFDNLFQKLKQWVLSIFGIQQTSDILDKTVEPFNQEPPSFSISGKVTELPVNGVARIDLSGDATQMTVTAADGVYSFDGLLRGTYVVTPSLSGHTFTPSFKTLTLQNADIVNVDFIDPTIKPNPWLGLQASQWRGGVRR